MNWNPIETAPKDGSVLVYCPDNNWKIYVANRDSYGGWMQSNSGWDCNPTHWMPLPPPPTEEGEAR